MEQSFISWLQSRLPEHPNVLLGIGDDAAVLQLGRRSNCVVTSDLLNDGVDFILQDVDPQLVGRKALAVNLSDLAAMAAKPIACVVSLALPRDGALELAKSLYEGLLPLADEFNIAIAGGDTNTWDGPLAISITAIGETAAAGPLLRSGARAGDAIVVTGAFGGSIIEKHLRFTPRVHEILAWNERFEIHAATDVSDGLSLDLSHIMHASGCGAEIDVAIVPITTDAAVVASRSGKSPLIHALTDGEDFELILAVPVETAEMLLRDPKFSTPVTRIGTFRQEPGLTLVHNDGTREQFVPRGYEH